MESVFLDRRSLLALAGCAGIPQSAWPMTARKRPNIVFIMADDLGYADVSCFGCTDYRTPHIDSLAEEGMKLEQSYANSAVCSPTRLALMTGRYQYRLRAGLEEPITPRNGARNSTEIGLPPAHPTLPSLLKAAGYGTALVGKWHLGFPAHFGPLKSGYDLFFGSMAGGLDYFSHVEDARTREPGLYDGEHTVDKPGYLTDLLGDRAVQTIGDYAKLAMPFFLSLHFTAPHWPWEGPEDERESRRLTALADYDGGSRKTYGHMVMNMDANIGKVLAALRKHRLERDTIVIFTSDNGGERFSNVWPFTGKKSELLEGGIRIPTLIRWPRQIKPRSVSSQVNITMDWVPTLLAAAGTAPDSGYPPDGINLLPMLAEGQPEKPRILFWRHKAFSQRAVRSGDWKYLSIGGNEFLFNLAEDPRERANLRARQPAMFESLISAYAQWEKGMLPEQNDTFSEQATGEKLADHYNIIPAD